MTLLIGAGRMTKVWNPAGLRLGPALMMHPLPQLWSALACTNMFELRQDLNMGEYFINHVIEQLIYPIRAFWVG